MKGKANNMGVAEIYWALAVIYFSINAYNLGVIVERSDNIKSPKKIALSFALFLFFLPIVLVGICSFLIDKLNKHYKRWKR